MKYLLACLVLLFLFSCARTKKQTCEKIDETIRKSLDNTADKEKKELTIHDLKTVEYEMIGEGRIDSLRKETYSKLITSYVSAYSTTQTAQDLKKAQANLDSANYYMKLDSLTTLQITNRYKDPKTYYYSKTFVNMTYGNKNTVDTLHYIIDKFFKLVKL